jgi:uncharacterized SAM-binding protein YcdF (DUF218 family)
MKKPSLLLLLVGAVLAGSWLYGFLNFAEGVADLREPDVHADLEATQAIVVLTGGSERVATGIGLLESGKGKKLFISGVHKNLSLESVLRALPVPTDMRACCIVLGYQAGSTAGNAEETRAWMAIEGFTSLRLVTANYHMPRSLLLFRTEMPDATIIPHPVAPDNVKFDEWWKHPGTISLLATEYGKYLIATFELWLNGRNAS